MYIIYANLGAFLDPQVGQHWEIWAAPGDGQPSDDFTGSECHWMVPGTIDPMAD